MELEISVDVCRVLLMPDSLSLVWGHSVHFAKCPILRFSKHYSFNNFHHILPKLHAKNHNQGLIWAITFLAICQKLTILWHFETLLTQHHMGLEISKTLLLLQFSSDVSQTF